VIDVSLATPGYEMEGIYFLEPGDRDAFISENRIIGPLDWIEGRSAYAYGLVIGGTGHIICYNEFELVGRSRRRQEQPAIITEGCDIYGTDLSTDDGVGTMARATTYGSSKTESPMSSAD
jgi:hypothetical protein